MDGHDAAAAFISDLHWQIDQMAPRGIKDRAGNRYNRVRNELTCGRHACDVPAQSAASSR